MKLSEPSPRFALLLAVLGAATGFQPTLAAAQDPAVNPSPQIGQPAAAEDALTIVVLAGEDGINIVKRKTAVAPVVEVRDRNKQPIAGAVVNFNSPKQGPSLTFTNGSHTFSVVTEANGRASVSRVTPVGKGSFQLTITATYDGIVASAIVKQTNYETAAEVTQAGKTVPAQTAGVAATHSGLSGAAIAGIVAGVAGAAALGIVLGLRHSSSSSTIGVGTPTVGAPH